MSMNELIDRAEYLVDDHGNKKAVVLDMVSWQELIQLLEDLEDAAEVQRTRDAGAETVDWQQAKSELRAQGVDV